MKDHTEHMLAALEAQHADAATRRNDMDTMTALLSLKILAVKASHIPGATHIVFDWSDQGDWLTVTGIDGDDLTDEAEDEGMDLDDDTGYAGALGEFNESSWMPFFIIPDNEIRNARQGHYPLRLAIATGLGITV